MYVLYTDGGYRQDVKLAASAYILTKDNLMISSGVVSVGNSNNECEYNALIEGLNAAIEFTDVLSCISDSMLIVNQVNNRWNVNSVNLIELHKKVVMLMRIYKSVDIKWMPRETYWISQCDKMCNDFMDGVI